MQPYLDYQLVKKNLYPTTQYTNVNGNTVIIGDLVVKNGVIRGSLANDLDAAGGDTLTGANGNVVNVDKITNGGVSIDFDGKNLTNVGTISLGNITTSGDITMSGAGKKIIMEGGLATDFIGTATLVNGTVTVLNTNIAANDKIFLTRATTAGTVVGILRLGTLTAATSFVIESVDAAGVIVDDDSTVNYLIIRMT